MSVHQQGTNPGVCGMARFTVSNGDHSSNAGCPKRVKLDAGAAGPPPTITLYEDHPLYILCLPGQKDSVTTYSTVKFLAQLSNLKGLRI